MAGVATRARRPSLVHAIVLGNLAWVAGSLWIMFGGWIAPNALGLVFVGAQAAVVALLAWLEWQALRRSQRLALAPMGTRG